MEITLSKEETIKSTFRNDMINTAKRTKSSRVSKMSMYNNDRFKGLSMREKLDDILQMEKYINWRFKL